MIKTVFIFIFLFFPLLGFSQEIAPKDCLIIQLRPEDKVVDLRQVQKGARTVLRKSGTIESEISPTLSVARFNEAIKNSQCAKIPSHIDIVITYQGKTYEIRQADKLLALIYNREDALNIVKKMEKTFLDTTQIEEKKCSIIQEEINEKYLYYVVQVKQEKNSENESVLGGEYLSEGHEKEFSAQNILNTYLERGYCSLSEEKYTSQGHEPTRQAFK
ncbi:MAG TPA: hypothetical protein PLJ21_02795 [Pseudobdellovibrionaceae bacterium]|nr:hypothetical protein [Pseudobdellovibrionaceae bacterium]